MKISVIDIGSNSVRLMMWADGKTLYKRMKTTRLGEGLNDSGLLSDQAISRTAAAVRDFAVAAQKDGAEKVYAFATAAVRSASNGKALVDAVKRLCGLTVDVLSGEREAQAGILGALDGKDGGIIDVGGASTEVNVSKGGKTVFSKSVNVGTVRILDAVGRDYEKIKEFALKKIAEFGDCDFSQVSMRCIGGTASRLACVKLGLMEYDSARIDGLKLTVSEVEKLSKLMTSMSVEEIKNTTICDRSADLFGGGVTLIYLLMKQFKISEITVSEKDNLEGYALSRYTTNEK